MSDEQKSKEDQPPRIPTLNEAIADVSSDGKPDLPVLDLSGISFESAFDKLSSISEKDYAHLKGLVDHYKHKSRWSHFLILLMAFMVLFQSFLLWKVGTGAWDFSKYEWLLPSLLVQNLAQIVGLAVFVVKALFRDMKWD